MSAAVELPPTLKKPADVEKLSTLRNQCHVGGLRFAYAM
jgi:hypothetical protein